MQIEALETFIKISEVGNFNKASELLFVTQSTVSARIHNLEESLGQQLFTRSRSAVTLTQAGRVFLPYARAVVRNWQKARQEIALPKGFSGILAVAATPSLWRDVLLERIEAFQKEMPAVALNALVADANSIIGRLSAGEIDVAITYEPTIKTGWSTTRLFTEELLLVSTVPRGLVRWDPGYVYVTWCNTFSEDHFRAYPVDDTPIVTFNDADVALQYVLRTGGSGYFPRRWVEAHPGRLHPVANAPVFKIDAFATFDAELLSAGFRRELVDRFVAVLAG